MATYQTIPPISKSDKTVFVDKQALIDVGSDTEKITDNASSKRKIAGEQEYISELNSEQSKETDTENKIKEEDKDSIFSFDYISLYDHAKRVMMNGTSTILFTKAKYFLPMLITKVYLNAVLASVVQSKPFYFFIVSAALQVVFLLFMLFVRPFVSKFTNFRIILVSLALIAANVAMEIYIYNSQNNNYLTFYEQLTIYLILATLAAATIFIIL